MPARKGRPEPILPTSLRNSAPRPLLTMNPVPYGTNTPKDRLPDNITVSVSEHIMMNCSIRIPSIPSICKFTIDGEAFEISPQDLLLALREFADRKVLKPTEPPNRFESLEDA